MLKKYLVVGAGKVSGPCVDYLLRQQAVVTVVSALQDELDHMSTTFPSARVVKLDLVGGADELQNLVDQHDMVISLIPTQLHPVVAKCCIKGRKNMTTASYESDGMRALKDSAVAAGITILNEIGLDPGIDHMLAMKCFDQIRQQGGEITSYTSMCGGIPAPECSHGPLRYKFSWYPKGSFVVALAPAQYIRDGKLIQVEAGHTFDQPEIICDLVENEEMECVPNRDSLVYRELYSLDSATTCFRGTLRYKGFSSKVVVLYSLGFTNDDKIAELALGAPGITWRELTCKLLGIPQDSAIQEISNVVQGKLGDGHNPMDVLNELGLLSKEVVSKDGTVINALCTHLNTHGFAYGPGERDMVVMRTEVDAIMPSGESQRHTFDLLELGQVQGHSAMSRCVGLTVAIAAELVAEGSVKRKGVIFPMTSDIYVPTLKRLEEEGIKVKSTVTQIDKN